MQKKSDFSGEIRKKKGWFMEKDYMVDLFLVSIKVEEEKE